MLRRLILGRILAHLETYTVQDVSVFGVFLVCIQSEFGKIQTKKTPNTATFHAVIAEYWPQFSVFYDIL